METSKLEIVNQTLSNNRVDSNTEPQLISGADMLALENAETLDKSPEYQRPYTKLDGTKGYTGDDWQKALIVAFLTGKFIQPIHHRYNPNKKKWEIVDGGHRTRTILNFFKGMLKTPSGFNFEYEGKVYDLGNKTWTDISFDEPNICYVLNALSLIFALSIDANVNPRSVILFLAVILSIWLGELRNVKHMSIGSSIRFFIYFCDIFYLLSESNYFYNLLRRFKDC